MGFFFEKDMDYKDIYFFKKDITIKEFVYRQNCKIDKKMLKKFKETYPNSLQRTISSQKLIKNIKEYCQKDSIIFINYMKKINNLPNKK